MTDVEAKRRVLQNRTIAGRLDEICELLRERQITSAQARLLLESPEINAAEVN